MDVVLDKSYLQAAKTGAVRSVCQRHNVMFSDPLLYELLTTDERSRRVCFSKLPDQPNPVALLPRAGPLMYHEKLNHEPVGPLSRHVLDITFTFSPHLKAADFVMIEDQERALREWAEEIRREVADFPQMARSISHWCPQIESLAGMELVNECQKLKQEAVTDPTIVCRIYGDLDLKEFPAYTQIDPSWALFRWVQAHLLFYLDHIARYGFVEQHPVTKRIEHDLHDMQYAILAALTGALASTDHELIRNFQLMRPDGTVIHKGAKLLETAKERAYSS